jgi:hypothetical protein
LWSRATVFLSLWNFAMRCRPKDRAAATFETYPELDVAEVLGLCVPALSTDELAREMRDARQQLIAEIRKRARL